jgi:hypothetical protein
MLVSAFVPFSILSVAMLTWRPATQTHLQRTLTSIAIGVVGVVGFVVLVQVAEGLVGQLAPGLLPSPHETTVWHAYGFEWLVALGYLIGFRWVVGALSQRRPETASPPVLTTSR